MYVVTLNLKEFKSCPHETSVIRFARQSNPTMIDRSFNFFWVKEELRSTHSEYISTRSVKIASLCILIFNFFIESKSTVTKSRGFIRYPFNCHVINTQWPSCHTEVEFAAFCCGRQNLVQFSYFIHSCTRVTLWCQLDDPTIELNCRRLRVLVFNGKATFTLKDPV